MNKHSRVVDRFRDRLAFHDAMPQLVVLGLVSGIAAALIIVLFRLAVELPLAVVFDGNVEGFESLPPLWRFLLPFTGALLIGLILHFLNKRDRGVGVSHVLDRLHQHQGKLPVRNILVQFVGGVVALLTGQSVGREGPSIHLGAGLASLLGQWLRLPNNSLRTLVACGAAAAIAASFNTPMAGVIFAMEVILMEYTIAGFIPVILAAVTGAAISQLVFGAQLNFEALTSTGNLVTELPFLIVVGLVISVVAASFIKLSLACQGFQNRPLFPRFIVIGLITGAVATVVPQIMGTGYDTLDQVIGGEVGLQLLLLLVAGKLLVTPVVTGLGMVGGVIGPTLIVGAGVGGLLGMLGAQFLPGISEPQLYVMLGMVAMMGAVLNAPLAALVAILELTYSPGLIFPGMLIVVVACLGVQLGFRYRGIYTEQLHQFGFDLYAGPGKQFLSRVGVRSVMNKSLYCGDPCIPLSKAEDIVADETLWLVIRIDDGYRLLATANLVRFLDEDVYPQDARTPVDRQETGSDGPGMKNSRENPQGGQRNHEAGPQDGERDNPEQVLVEGNIHLDRLPATQIDVEIIDSLATLYEASERIRQSGAGALLVADKQLPARVGIIGVLNRETILSYYGM